MLANKPKTKIRVDGGDPEETLRVKESIGFVDGQTTNPLVLKAHRIAGVFAFGDLARWYPGLFSRPEGFLYHVSGD